MEKYLVIDPCYLRLADKNSKLRLVRKFAADDGDHLVFGDDVDEEIGSDSGTIAIYEILDETVMGDIYAGLSGFVLTDDASVGVSNAQEEIVEAS